MKRILVTGGAGYIGSHTVIELVKNGFDVVIVDNFVNASPLVLERLEKIVDKKLKLYDVDCCDYNAFEEVFKKEHIDAAIHFAGLKAVGESVQKPLEYFSNNLESLLNLLKLMRKYDVKNMVFSSSATVYGKPKSVPIKEDASLSVTNPYGRTKLMIEDICRDYSFAQKDMNIALLRYFNPIGAHESGLIGENPNGIPNNLVPYITQVCIGKLDHLRIFGNDYDTPDGTGVRDYIHVVDLAYGHVCALNKLFTNPGLVTYNLGTGIGYSVLDVLHAMEKAVGHEIPYKFYPRRSGDIDMCYADCTAANIELNWHAKYSIDDMCASSWKWQKNNPNGFEK